jgi:hypothetical protein
MPMGQKPVNQVKEESYEKDSKCYNVYAVSGSQQVVVFNARDYVPQKLISGKNFHPIVINPGAIFG